MKLREVFESAGVTVGVCFGRWNPPHQGHKAAWETAAQFDHWFVGTNKNTEGPSDPLPYDVKLKCMETIWPEVRGHVIPEANLFSLATKVYGKYGEQVHLKVATDEQWLTSSLVKYNGLEGAHGYYKFASIEHVATPRLSSATALRAAVRAGDRDAFSEAAGVDANTPIHIGKKAVAFFDLVAHYLAKHPEKVKKTKAVAETQRMSAQVKLQRAWERERAKSDASRERMNRELELIARNMRKDNPHYSQDEFKDTETKEDAAGVGTITKQNSTADVNASTPGKNLRAFSLEGIEMTMAAIEKAMLDEAKTTKLNPHHDNVSRGVARARDIGGYDRVYHMNRMGMAMAMADGHSTSAVDSPAETWVEKYNTYHPLTQEEDKMIKAAFATVPTDSQWVSTYGKSVEPTDTNKTSAVAKPKRNKYGV